MPLYLFFYIETLGTEYNLILKTPQTKRPRLKGLLKECIFLRFFENNILPRNFYFLLKLLSKYKKFTLPLRELDRIKPWTISFVKPYVKIYHTPYVNNEPVGPTSIFYDI